MGGSVVAGGRTLLLPKCVSMLSWYRRGLSLAADASKELVQPEGGVPHMPPFDFTTQPYEEIQLAKRKNLLNPALFLYYKKHLNIVEGRMQYLFDESGRRCLDAFAGIVTMSLGHGHSAVLDAVVKQTKLLQHTIVNYAEALAQRMPGNLKVVYLVNSGLEANDMAMMMARLYTGSFNIVALRNAYHGMSPSTMGLTAHSTWKYNVAQGFGVHHALNPDPYRGLLVPMATPTISPTFLSLLYLAALLGFFIRLSRSFPTPSVSYTLRTHICFFKDVDQSDQDSAMLAGEAVELAPRIYLPAAYEIVRKAGACALQMKFRQVLVVTDTNFWGFQNQGVTPDIVTLAKLLLRRQRLQYCLQRLHFYTYGGNPVCSAAGHAVLEVLDKEKGQEHCASVGDHLLDRLRGLQDKHDVIGNVRGRGLMLGVELVKN